MTAVHVRLAVYVCRRAIASCSEYILSGPYGPSLIIFDFPVHLLVSAIEGIPYVSSYLRNRFTSAADIQRRAQDVISTCYCFAEFEVLFIHIRRDTSNQMQ